MKHFINSIFVALTLLAFVACSNEEVEREDNGMANVKMTIATRATGTAEMASNDAEKINTWWVAFINAQGNVQKIIERTTGSAVEEETFALDIPKGTYTVYAFANILKTDMETAGYTFTEGNTCPRGIDAATWTITNGFTGNIPMSGKQSVTVTGRANETFSVEVVRLLAKMEFQYTNKSNRDVTVNSISIRQVQPSKVSLLPNYAWLNDGRPYLNTGGAVSNMKHNYTSLNVPRVSGPVNGTFYMIESLADYAAPSKCYTLTLNIRRQGASEDENLYFMLDNSIQTIYRNDHIVVPITITDYIVGLDADFYPPIGGFPAIITEDRDKDEFYCTFKTQGEFSLLPTVQHSVSNTPVYYPYWDYASTEVTVTGDDIFTTKPYIDPKTGELLGKLSTAEGTACISITIKVRTSISPEVVYQTYTRKIYIIRKN